MIELGAFQRGFRLNDGGLGGLQRLPLLIDDGVSNVLALDQLERAIEVAFAEFDAGPRVGKLAVDLGGGSIIRAGVDEVEQVVLADDLAVAEADAGNEAADPGANVDLLDRLEAAGEFVPIGHGALDRGCDRHRRRRCGRSLRGLFAAGGKSKRGHEKSRTKRDLKQIESSGPTIAPCDVRWRLNALLSKHRAEPCHQALPKSLPRDYDNPAVTIL